MPRTFEVRRLLAALLCVLPMLSCAADPEGAAEQPSSPAAEMPPADPPEARGEAPDAPAGTAHLLPADTPSADAGGPMIHPQRDPPSGGGTTDAEGATPGTQSRPVSPADTATWTIELAFAPERVGAAALPVLTALRTGTHDDYARMTVEIGPEASGPPGYRVEYIDRPLIECGSGDQIFPIGDAWLEVRLEPAAAHTESGQPTLGARETEVEGPHLLRVYRTCNFEGIVTHVMALSSPNPFRVLTLSDPWRIVVDVQR